MSDNSAPAVPSAPAHAAPGPTRLLPLTLTALGVVYGDIGTSPLYAINECFYGSHGVPPTAENVLGEVDPYTAAGATSAGVLVGCM